MLTAKQEKFVLGIVEGLTQREAYKRAYNTSNMKDKTIDEKACKVMATDKVRARFRELMEELKKNAIWTRQEAINDLIWFKDITKSDIMDKGVRQANSSAFINTIKELNQLEALYPTKKEEENKDDKLADTLQGLLDTFRSEGEC